MNRSEWCAVVAAFTSPAFRVEATQALLRMLSTMNKWPDSWFTAETAEAVALAKHRQSVPSLGEIKEALDQYRRDHEPLVLQIAGRDDGMTTEDRMWLAHYHKRRADLFAAQSGFRLGSREADLRSLDSLVRSQSPKAWREIAGDEEVVSAPIAPVVKALRAAKWLKEHGL